MHYRYLAEISMRIIILTTSHPNFFVPMHEVG